MLFILASVFGVQWSEPGDLSYGPLDTGQELRQIGASAICGLQKAIGVFVTYQDAVEEWDTLLPEQRRMTLKSYELLNQQGDYVLLDPKVENMLDRSLVIDSLPDSKAD
jgi:hypothetical protein